MHKFECSLLLCKMTHSLAIIKLSTKCQNCVTHFVVQHLLCYCDVAVYFVILISRCGNEFHHICSFWSVLIAFETNNVAGMNTQTALSVVAGFFKIVFTNYYLI